MTGKLTITIQDIDDKQELEELKEAVEETLSLECPTDFTIEINLDE